MLTGKAKKLFFAFFVVLFFVICAAPAAMAQQGVPDLKNPLDNLQVRIPGLEKSTVPSTGNKFTAVWLSDYLIAIYQYAIGVIGVLAVLGIAIGGLMWVMAAGNTAKIDEARSWITSSILGVVLALTAYLMLAMINPGLVTLNPPTLSVFSESTEWTSGGGTLTGSYQGGRSFRQDVTAYDTLLTEYAEANDVEFELAKAVMMAESNGDPNAISPAGARGLMQVMPGTAASMGVTGDLLNPENSIEAGTKYLSKLMTGACNNKSSNDVCDVNDLKYIIAAYNGGPGCNKPSSSCPGLTWWECEKNSGYDQTRKYVIKVLANYKYYKEQAEDEDTQQS